MPIGVSPLRVLIASLPMNSFAVCRFLAAVEHVKAAEMAAATDVEVVRYRSDRDDAFLLAVFRTQRDACAHRVARRGETRRLAFERDVAGGRLDRAVDELHQLRTPGADEPEEADYLALARGERGRFAQPLTQ